tara:strand:- start:116 stop:880 length:765 start_codon:yes stop_codon:yes gene_type:complete
MELIIDNRESLKDYFIDKEFKWCKTKNLDIGDYIFNYNNELVCIIERKTIDDLANSIKDGRYREQKERLLTLFPKNKIIYLIEGDITKPNKSIKYNKVSKKTIYSSLINVYLRDNIAVHRTSNISESIEFIKEIGEKIEKQGTKFVNNTDKSDSLFNNLKSQKKQIDQKLVYKLQLSAIPSISSKSADAIILKYPNFNVLFNSLSNLSKEERFAQLNLIKCKSGDKYRKLSKRVLENLDKYLFLSTTPDMSISS